jgi:hypothetical protein
LGCVRHPVFAARHLTSPQTLSLLFKTIFSHLHDVCSTALLQFCIALSSATTIVVVVLLVLFVFPCGSLSSPQQFFSTKETNQRLSI